MKTIPFSLLAAAGVLLLANPSLARKIALWEYDSLDCYYEPAAKTQVSCTWGLRRTLTRLGHDVSAFHSLPKDLNPFDIVFVSLGWSRG